MPRDRQLVAATRERVAFLLRDHGYPNARAQSGESPGSQPKRVVVTIAATPGQAATFGDVSVVGLSSVHESLVRRTLSFEADETYRESRVIESQRRLRKLGIFEFAHVRSDPQAEATLAASRLPMVVTLSEGRPTRTEFGLGYGSEDGPRGSARWEHLNFLGDARRFTADARYSTRLRGAGIDFVEPYFLTPTVSFGANYGSWWTDEPTHTARNRGGRFGITWRRSSERGTDLDPSEHVVRFGYRNESLRFAIDPATRDDLSQFEQLIALGLDPLTGEGSGRLATLEVQLARTALDRLADPRSGHALSLIVRHAAPWLGGSYRYDEAIAEGRLFVPLGDQNVWATRVRVGAILGGLGGAGADFRALLSGRLDDASRMGPVSSGTSHARWASGRWPRGTLDMSTEWRFRVRGAFGAALFVDAGNVWSGVEGLAAGKLRVDVGPGLRWLSPLGIVRADFGIQLTPIDGLLVNGAPETRQWRLHFSIGHPF